MDQDIIHPIDTDPIIANTDKEDSYQNTEMKIAIDEDKSKTEKQDDFEVFKGKIYKGYKQISISRKMRKFYSRRYLLFNRFDDGILMDVESWYSVTPEKIAYHIAKKCFESLGSNSNLTVLDGFCGAGGNSIQFAKFFNNVISCDIDLNKLQCAKYNANLYQVDSKIQFLKQDFFNLDKTLNLNNSNSKIDLIFLSPPWGGVNYYQTKQADISQFPLDGFDIFLYCLNNLKCKNIIYYLPRNTNIDQIMYLAGVGGRVEIEQNFLDHKFVAISAYYGDLCPLSDE